MKTFILLLALAAVALGDGDAKVKVVDTVQDAVTNPLVAPEEVSIIGFLEDVAIPAAEARKKLEEEYLKTEASRIVGGQPASLGQFSYQAGLIMDITGQTGQGICGASLISNNRVLTAAHCWFDGRGQAWRVTVVLGSVLIFSGGTRLQSTNVVMHPQWNWNTISNDIAMIILPSSVSFNNNISPVNLPSGSQLNENFAGDTGTVAGFGLTADNAGIGGNQFLSFIRQPVLTNSVCFWTFPIIQNSNVCLSGAGGMSPCSGDSGGALVVTRNNVPVQIGVVSYGRNTCQGGHPVVFARVTSFMSWINSNL